MEMKKIIPLILVTLMLGCQADQKSIINDPTVTGLKTFESCEALADFLMAKGGEETPSAPTPTDGAEGEAGADSPSTDVQQTAVEEADLVKQEGDRLYVVNSGWLIIYDVSQPAVPKKIGDFQLIGGAEEIYVYQEIVAVIGASYYPITFFSDSDSDIGNYPTTKVALVDVSDASAPELIREISFSGSYSDSRKVGSALYLAFQNSLSAVNENSLIDTLKEETNCSDVYVPEDLNNGSYGTYPLWNLVGLNLADTDADPTQASVVGSWSSVIYSTPSHLYLTSYFYESHQSGIYLFDLDPSTAAASPRAHNFIPGSVLNQFSMDEFNGVFRIASTLPVFNVFFEDPVNDGTALHIEPPPTPTQTTNYMTTFKVNDGSLDPLGQIDTIVPGESITAARFVENTSYVTTFVITDPLVTVDLSNPSNPKVLGELHIPGSTSYLQAWGNDRLVAIGSGGNFFGNVILNLFDVSDLANPKLIEQEPVEGAFGSEAQFEHLAFSFFEDKQIVAFPVYDAEGSSLRLFSVNRNTGFTPIGSISHDDLITSGDYSPVLRRSLDISDLLYSVSNAGLKVNAFNNPSSDLFEELFPGFTPPSGGICGCFDDVCSACPEPL